MQIAIIGAGPAGMSAALQAAWRGADVTLFERNERPGRKLLVTGAGHCNLTNDAASPGRYACADPGWLARLFETFGRPELLAMLKEIGVAVYKTSDGWYYPISNSAQSVADAFSAALRNAGVNLRPSTRVTGIDAGRKGFTLQLLSSGAENSETFPRVIVAAGGAAYPTLGSRGELFPALARLGHSVKPKRPALAPVLAELGALQTLQGVRLDVCAAVYEGKKLLGQSAGNLIFTEWGLNGPAVMDVSHIISARPEARLSLSLNLLHFYQAEFDEMLAIKRKSALPVGVFLEAFFPPKVAAVYLKQVHLPEDLPLSEVTDDTLARLVGALRDTRLKINGVRGFEYCQVSAGGVPVSEVDPVTMESLRAPGLYLAGETLDVVGPCGGYNLQFAFSSGAAAGIAAAAGK